MRDGDLAGVSLPWSSFEINLPKNVPCVPGLETGEAIGVELADSRPSPIETVGASWRPSTYFHELGLPWVTSFSVAMFLCEPAIALFPARMVGVPSVKIILIGNPRPIVA